MRAYGTGGKVEGGYTQAEEDFDSLKPSNVKDIPYGKTGVLADGRKITVRSKSLDTRVTLEIQSPRKAFDKDMV